MLDVIEKRHVGHEQIPIPALQFFIHRSAEKLREPFGPSEVFIVRDFSARGQTRVGLARRRANRSQKSRCQVVAWRRRSVDRLGAPMTANGTVSVHVSSGLVASAPGAMMHTTRLPARCAIVQSRSTLVCIAKPERSSSAIPSPGSDAPVIPCRPGQVPLNIVG